MRWHDFDHNGRIDGRDYYIMNELLNSHEEEKAEDADIFSDDESENDDNDLW